MMKGKRWTAEEKLAFIQEAEREGVVTTCRRYGTYASLYYQCLSAIQAGKRRYDALGIEGLSGRRSRGPEFERLMRENQRLKQPCLCSADRYWRIRSWS